MSGNLFRGGLEKLLGILQPVRSHVEAAEFLVPTHEGGLCAQKSFQVLFRLVRLFVSPQRSGQRADYFWFVWPRGVGSPQVLDGFSQLLRGLGGSRTRKVHR